MKKTVRKTRRKVGEEELRLRIVHSLGNWGVASGIHCLPLPFSSCSGGSVGTGIGPNNKRPRARPRSSRAGGSWRGSKTFLAPPAREARPRRSGFREVGPRRTNVVSTSAVDRRPVSDQQQLRRDGHGRSIPYFIKTAPLLLYERSNKLNLYINLFVNNPDRPLR